MNKGEAQESEASPITGAEQSVFSEPGGGGQDELPMIDTLSFIAPQAFKESLQNKVTYEVEKPIIAGILPHHNVAYRMMGDFYATLANSEDLPDVILMLGPDHFGAGGRFSTGNFVYNTYGGRLVTQQDIFQKLIDSGTVGELNSDLFAKEHSLNIHMNYVACYYKGIPVVPLLVSENRSDKDLDGMADILVDAIGDQKVLILCSIDFSHYLTLEEANEKDAYTEELLLTKNQEDLILLKDDHVDCPSAIVLMLKLLEKKGMYTPTILDHGNSQIISGDVVSQPTTSYFTVIYTLD